MRILEGNVRRVRGRVGTGSRLLAGMLAICAARSLEARSSRAPHGSRPAPVTAAGAGPLAPAICPSGSCLAPIAVLPPPTTRCQTTSLTLTCANPATYQIVLVQGQTTMERPAADLLADPAVGQMFLGIKH